MSARRAAAVVCLLVGLGFAATAPAQPKAGPAGPETKAVAERLVKQVAQVKPGEIVFIGGDPRDLGLLEDLYIEVRKQGGQAFLQLEREPLMRRYYDEVPAAHDGRDVELALKLWQLPAVQLFVEGSEFPEQLRHVPPARLAANAKKWEAVNKLITKRNLRRVILGNGLYPTAATAKQFGLTKAQLAKVFWDGVSVDPARVQANAEAVRAVLVKGKEVRVTNPNGTDLTLRVAGRPVLTSDGIFTAAKLKKGGIAAWTWLPAGEVYLAPVPRSAAGTIVVTRIPFEGGEIEGLRLTVKGGKVVTMTAKPSPAFDRFKARFDAALGRKDELGVIDVGVNPAVAIPKGSKLLTWVAAGMVTLMIGENTWAGGDNGVNFGVAWHLPGSTLLVDGRPLVENGALKLPPGPTAAR